MATGPRDVRGAYTAPLVADGVGPRRRGRDSDVIDNFELLKRVVEQLDDGAARQLWFDLALDVGRQWKLTSCESSEWLFAHREVADA